MVWFQLYIEIALWDFWTYNKSWRPVSLVLSVVLLSTTRSQTNHRYRLSSFVIFFMKVRKIFTIRPETRKLSKIHKTYAKNVRLDRYVILWLSGREFPWYKHLGLKHLSLTQAGPSHRKWYKIEVSCAYNWQQHAWCERVWLKSQSIMCNTSWLAGQTQLIAYIHILLRWTKNIF